ncbi:MAG: SIMPL domain-containing protein [Candidatus Sungbacteria bacterium]|nr:SIMPL domain-containing protein [Candidatus Sungbacteria bacterium]
MDENMQKFGQFLGERGRNQFVILLNLFMLILILYFAVSVLKLWGTRPTGELPRQLAVAGEGKTSVKPDVAVFTASTVTQASRVKDAQAQNTARSDAILYFLKKHGVEDKNLKTTEYNIYPQYQSSFPPPCIPPGPCPLTTVRPPEIVSYQVRQTIEIKARDLGKADDLLSGVVASGANEVGSITFRVDDPEAARAIARKKAIDDAMAKAQTLAADLGVRLKHIVSYSDESVPPYPPPYMVNGLAEAKGIAAAAPGPQVQPDEQEITANVTLVYEFR